MFDHVLNFSSGITSWAAGMRVAKTGIRPQIVFADTLVEDEDNYRFLIEGAASIAGCNVSLVADLAGEAMKIPPLIPGTREERKKRLADRKAAILLLRQKAVGRITDLSWVIEGRSPWEVFEDVRFIGNSRVDPCSRILKRQLLDNFFSTYCHDQTVFYMGLDWKEPKRINRFRDAMRGRRLAFPMADSPFMLKEEVIAWSKSIGVNPPRLYDYGFPHANCGGFCCKAGQSEMRRLYHSRRDYYLYNEQCESDVREIVGVNFAMMRDKRRGHDGLPMPLSQFRERVESGEWDDNDKGSCNCFENPNDEDQ
jgi:hypothetical protein